MASRSEKTAACEHTPEAIAAESTAPGGTPHYVASVDGFISHQMHTSALEDATGVGNGAGGSFSNRAGVDGDSGDGARVSGGGGGGGAGPESGGSGIAGGSGCC